MKANSGYERIVEKVSADFSKHKSIQSVITSLGDALCCPSEY